MRNSILRNAVIAGAICAVLAVPSFAMGTGVWPKANANDHIVTIGPGADHWSEKYINHLSENYNAAPVFDGKVLDDAITTEDFKDIVRLAISGEYDGAPDSTTREAVVHELVRIWAKETGQDRERIPTIKMIIYSDTDRIDIKYSHSITVAYMKGIAKGKSARFFDPKADVTYGELAVLICNTVKAIEAAMDLDDASTVMQQVEMAAQQYLPEGAKFAVGDLDADGVMEMAYISRTDADIPSVKLQVYSYISGSFELEYENELEVGGYPDSVIIGQTAQGRQAIFVDIGVGAHSGVTKILLKENGEYKSALADSEVPLTFKPYPLISKDINGDGIVEIGIHAAPAETDHMAMAEIPWIGCWYQWDGKDGLTAQPVMTEYSNHTEGYRFIIPANWKDKYTIERETAENQAVRAVRFIYLSNEKERAELLAISHIPKADWVQQKQQLIEDEKPYLLLGQNNKNMLVAMLPTEDHGLSADSMIEYEKMKPNEKGIRESFITLSSVVYENAEYGFKFYMPESWSGYSIVMDNWEGLAVGETEGQRIAETGPIVIIRHPEWTPEKPRQDIPVMVFTVAKWEALQREEFHIGAVPIGPREIWRKDGFVFALPARYNYAFPTGYEEVEDILESSPFK